MCRVPTFLGALMAVALLLTVAAPAFAGDTKGQVVSIDATNLRFEMKVNGGEKRNYELGEDATTFIDKRVAAFKDLRVGDQISVTDRKDADRWYAIIINCERAAAAPAGAVDTKGQVVSVDQKNLRFEMKIAGGEKRTYQMGKDAKTFINKREATFKDLRAGDQVSVTDRKDADGWYAITINCERAVAGPGVVVDTKGQLVSVDAKDLRFEMKITGGEKRSYKLGEDATTFINNRVAAFEDRRVGDQISVTDRQGTAGWYAIIINCERK